jgi:MFS family permease
MSFLTKRHQTSASVRPETLATTVASVTGLCIMGDSLMNSLLPLEAPNLGIALPLVGILLSINRLIRIFSNTWVSTLFERFGTRKPFIISMALGVSATILYTIGSGFLLFLIARIAWGIAWSGLRQANFVTVGSSSENVRGRIIGLQRVIFGLGSTAALLAGGYLWDYYGFRTAFGLIASVSAIAIPISLFIRWPNTKPTGTKKPKQDIYGWRKAFETSSHRWLLGVGFLHRVFVTVLTSTTSLFLINRLDTTVPLKALGIGVGTVAGILLSLRTGSDLIFSRPLGIFSDRFGRGLAALLLAMIQMIAISGVVILSGVGSLLCLAIVFFASSGMRVTLDASASIVSTQSNRPHLVVGIFTTSLDIGAAAGPLLAYSLGMAANIGAIYILASSMLMLAVLRFWHTERSNS